MTMGGSLQQILAKPFALMGIVNVAPDSFYDGGRHTRPGEAVDHALRLAADGADILDIGGESTRPGSAPVPPQEELRRVLPVIEALALRTDLPISIDTTKTDVARAALSAGASWVNDISAGRFDSGMADLVAESGCVVVLMHSRKTPKDMQESPHYDDPVAEVARELLERIEVFLRAGVDRENVIVDPGIGFGKRVEDNLALLAGLDTLAGLGYPVLVGTSRKSFIGRLTGKEAPERLFGTLGSVAAAYVRGARIFRAHDVAETRDMLTVLSAVVGRRAAQETPNARA